MNEIELIHYGTTEYDPGRFKPISDIPFSIKPLGGLWASPINANFGWKEWCESAEYGSTENHFKVKFSGNLLTIDTLIDLNELPWIEVDGIHSITFQAMCSGSFTYDAIYLTELGESETRFSRPRSLYGWDCECVLILNPDSISPML